MMTTHYYCPDCDAIMAILDGEESHVCHCCKVKWIVSRDADYFGGMWVDKTKLIRSPSA